MSSFSIRKQSYSSRHPWIYAFLLTLLFLAVYFISGALVQVVLKLQNSLWVYGIANVVLTILSFVLILGARGGRNIGLTPVKGRDWPLFWLAFVPPIVNLALGFGLYGFNNPTITMVLVYLGLALLVGWNEEVFFRGLILRPLLQKGVWLTAVVTALLFGISHLLNVLAGQNVLYTILQIGYAIAIGFCFAALAIRTGTIWPLILAHFLTDFTGFLGGGPGASSVDNTLIIVAAVYMVVFLAYGIFLLVTRPKQKAY